MRPAPFTKVALPPPSVIDEFPKLVLYVVQRAELIVVPSKSSVKVWALAAYESKRHKAAQSNPIFFIFLSF
jgi:hypothetical protein